MTELFSIYAIGGGIVLLGAVLSARTTYTKHGFVAVQVLFCLTWAAIAAIHFWGAGIRICRTHLALDGTSLPVLAAGVWSVLFVIACVPCLFLIRRFARRLPHTGSRRIGRFVRAVCAGAAGLIAALLLTMNAALILESRPAAPTLPLIRQTARVPVRTYLHWSGNWSRPDDPPAGFPDFLDRHLDR